VSRDGGGRVGISLYNEEYAHSRQRYKALSHVQGNGVETRIGRVEKLVKSYKVSDKVSRRPTNISSKSISIVRCVTSW
jgi:hypothetical protein